LDVFRVMLVTSFEMTWPPTVTAVVIPLILATLGSF
jgi:hypothetical protein